MREARVKNKRLHNEKRYKLESMEPSLIVKKGNLPPYYADDDLRDSSSYKYRSLFHNDEYLGKFKLIETDNILEAYKDVLATQNYIDNHPQVFDGHMIFNTVLVYIEENEDDIAQYDYGTFLECFDLCFEIVDMRAA